MWVMIPIRQHLDTRLLYAVARVIGKRKVGDGRIRADPSATLALGLRLARRAGRLRAYGGPACASGRAH